MENLKKQYDEKLAEKEELRVKAEQMEIKLDRAGKLVSGLAGERERWETNVGVSYPNEHCFCCIAVIVWYLQQVKT